MIDLNGHADATFAASNEVLETTKRLFDHTRGVQSNGCEKRVNPRLAASGGEQFLHFVD